MGGCFSKKEEAKSTAVVSKSVSLPVKVVKVVNAATSEKNVEKSEMQDLEVVKNEVFVIKHRKSHDKQIHKLPQEMQSREENIAIGTPVRTSSCTREEVDAILIQCGRLSRSSSANTPSGKKYSGSKRSYDFDAEEILGKDEGNDLEKRRQSRSRSSLSKPGRRRTPSRERDSSQQRSVAGFGRRVSRSPGRRSETPIVSGVEGNNVVTRPGILVSVPASVTSSIMAGNEQNSIKRIAVKRDVRSPRSQSPAQVRQPPSQPLILSRSNSRKNDQSPYRRNPLTEIDNNHSSQKALRKSGPNHQGVEDGANNKRAAAAAANGGSKVETRVVQPNSRQDDIFQAMLNRTKPVSRSRDFDEINRGPNQNPSSYASILLEDIQAFHQKSINSNVAFALPQSVTKACSIMDAVVADVNSTTSSSVMSNDEKKRGEKTKFEVRGTFVEKELAVGDDLSLHKYVTMRRGTQGGGCGSDMGDEESSGSNNMAGGNMLFLGA